MFRTFKDVLELLTTAERRQLYWLFAAITVMALLEVVGIVSIMPFLALVGNPDIIHTSKWMNLAYTELGFETERSFLIFTGVSALLILVAGNAFKAWTRWATLKFTHLRSHTLSLRLLRNYIYKPYVFYLDRNTNELGQNILDEVNRLVTGLMVPGIQAIARVIVAIAILALLIVTDPILAGIVFAVLGTLYGAVYLIVRRRLSTLGRERLTANDARFRMANESLNGIKELRLLANEETFIQQYSNPSEAVARRLAEHGAISAIPRYALEVVAFGGTMMIVLYLLSTRGNIGEALPIIGLYVFAGYRLMPAMQQIFVGFSNARFHLPALRKVREDLDKLPSVISHEELTRQQTRSAGESPIDFDERISLRNLSFRYPGMERPLFEKLDLAIEANSSVAFVGTTGSGKTTLVDLILGLLHPDDGEILIDGTTLTEANARLWQRRIGYVPQHIYLSDGTIAGNIAFGVLENKVDRERIQRAAQIAQIDDFITSELPKGYDTRTGEHGAKLSGGQRQRIGIARALYRDPDVLVLDEATSALDGATEERVFQALSELPASKTVLMIAHRFSTICNCDKIFLLKDGRLQDSGTYQALYDRSDDFRAMAGA
jgi:ATP-binding cassette subfamily C protein